MKWYSPPSPLAIAWIAHRGGRVNPHGSHFELRSLIKGRDGKHHMGRRHCRFHLRLIRDHSANFATLVYTVSEP